MKKPILEGIIIFCLLLPGFCYASEQNIIINEIAWMGTNESSNDEWIELYNNSSNEINLDGWSLKATDSSPEISLTGTIPAQGFFILERTDDSTLPNIIANQIYTGALSNSGESLKLYDNNNNLIDSADFSDSWPAGDNQTKQTMERIDNAWQTSSIENGTPNQLNSDGQPQEQPQEQTQTSEPQTEQPQTGSSAPQPANQPPIANAGPDITALVNQEITFDAGLSSDHDNDELTYFWNFGDGATDEQKISTHTYQYPGQYIVSLLVSDNEFSSLDIITVNIYNHSIIISEFLPNPDGDDQDNEWIEIYNQSDLVANLSGWQLDDQDGGSKSFVFPANSLIGPKQFLVIRRPISKISLNNDNDQVRLFYPNGALASQVSYLAEKKDSACVAFDGQDYFWTTIPTPGTANLISLTETDKNYSANNPPAKIKQSQEPILMTANLSQAQSFDTQNAQADIQESGSEQKSQTDIQPIITNTDLSRDQIVNLSNSTNKRNLILVLSIIVSGALMASWLIIITRKKIS